MAHALVEVVGSLEATLAEHAGASTYAYSADPAELEQAARGAYGLVNQILGGVLLPVLAEADGRKLFKLSECSSMKDLAAGWLRVSPTEAGRLVRLGQALYGAGGFEKTGAALAAGEIDRAQAAVVVNAIRKLPTGEVGPVEGAAAEDTMLTHARVLDAQYLGEAGMSLFHTIAPKAAENHEKKQLERDRRRAEESTWLEVHGYGIKGGKEIRFRAPSSVIDKLMAGVDPLAEPLEPEATGNDGADLRPRERRRADGLTELIEAMWSPELLAELTADQLRELADVKAAFEEAAAETKGAEADGAETDEADHDHSEPGHDDEQDTEDGLDHEDGQGDERFGIGERIDPDEAYDCGDGRDDADESGEVGEAGEAEAHDATDETEGTDETGIADADDADGDGDGESAPGSAHAGHNTSRRLRRPGKRVRRGKGVWCKPCAHWRPELPKFFVRVDFDHTTGELGIGMLDSGEKLSPTEVQRLACEAELVPVWARTNLTPVAVAATCRFFKGKQLAALILRDLGCCFPGCSRGLKYVHAHHIHPYKTTGKTTADDGVLLCGLHHRMIHEKQWKVRIAADGLPEYIPPAYVDPQQKPRRHIKHCR